ncbi:hypothetical protein KCU64_g71, partial [Aureobasidium melanogenum]
MQISQSQKKEKQKKKKKKVYCDLDDTAVLDEEYDREVTWPRPDVQASQQKRPVQSNFFRSVHLLIKIRLERRETSQNHQSSGGQQSSVVGQGYGQSLQAVEIGDGVVHTGDAEHEGEEARCLQRRAPCGNRLQHDLCVLTRNDVIKAKSVKSGEFSE